MNDLMNLDFFAGWCACLVVVFIRDYLRARGEKP